MCSPRRLWNGSDMESQLRCDGEGNLTKQLGIDCDNTGDVLGNGGEDWVAPRARRDKLPVIALATTKVEPTPIISRLNAAERSLACGQEPVKALAEEICVGARVRLFHCKEGGAFRSFVRNEQLQGLQFPGLSRGMNEVCSKLTPADMHAGGGGWKTELAAAVCLRSAHEMCAPVADGSRCALTAAAAEQELSLPDHKQGQVCPRRDVARFWTPPERDSQVRRDAQYEGRQGGTVGAAEVGGKGERDRFCGRRFSLAHVFTPISTAV